MPLHVTFAPPESGIQILRRNTLNDRKTQYQTHQLFMPPLMYWKKNVVVDLVVKQGAGILSRLKEKVMWSSRPAHTLQLPILEKLVQLHLPWLRPRPWPMR